MARAARAAVLLAVGILIAFTATQHEDFIFTQVLLVISFALIGAVTLAEHTVQRKDPRSWPIALRAAFAFVAAAALLISHGTGDIAIVAAAWATAETVLSLALLFRAQEPARPAFASALLHIALACAILLTRDDLVAIIGFVGAYAIIRGVFLGIAAFDDRSRSTASTGDPAAPATESL